MNTKFSYIGILAGLVLSISIPAAAATFTTPAGVLTAPNPGTVNDPPAFDTWLRDNVRNGASIGITNNYPRSGNGSGFLDLGPNSSAGTSGKADWEYFPTGSFFKLSALSSASYDWYRDASSTVNPILHPAFRLVLAIDGNAANTTNNTAYLIFERAYNGGGNAPTNAWTTDTIGASTNLWVSQPGVGIQPQYNVTLAQYQSGSYTPSAGFTKITGNSLIVGISIGIGSGWSATGNTAYPSSFRGAIDNATLTPAQGTAFTANLELPSVAATAAPALGVGGIIVLIGLLALAAISRRGRSTGLPSKQA